MSALISDPTGEVLMRKIIEVWLDADIGGGRHERRVKKIIEIEEGHDPRELI